MKKQTDEHCCKRIMQSSGPCLLLSPHCIDFHIIAQLVVVAVPQYCVLDGYELITPQWCV